MRNVGLGELKRYVSQWLHECLKEIQGKVLTNDKVLVITVSLEMVVTRIIQHDLYFWNWVGYDWT